MKFSLTRAAEVLGISRKQVQNLQSGARDVTPTMAKLCRYVEKYGPLD